MDWGENLFVLLCKNKYCLNNLNYSIQFKFLTIITNNDNRAIDAVVGVFPPTTLVKAPCGTIFIHHKNINFSPSKLIPIFHKVLPPVSLVENTNNGEKIVSLEGIIQ